MKGEATSECAEAVVMIRPQPRLFMPGTAARIVWKAEDRLIPMIAFHLSTGNMAKIKLAESGFHRIPLTVALSDSTHGEIKAFELLTCRVRDSDGAEGVGYTYTVGRNGGAVADVLRREIPD